jgi:pSer/pThr/pTyr-binding forkhead associated (FHA) protein
MVTDPDARTLKTPVFLWESISARSEPNVITVPGVKSSRPLPSDPLVFLVRKTGEPNALVDVSVGRTPNNDIIIDDGSVSRFHAVLRHDERSGQWWLIDVGSSNGTFARGERLEPRVPFELGFEEPLVLGSVSVRFLMPEAFFRYVDAMK